MKPLHVIILLAAGAIGGAVVLNVVHRADRDAPIPVAEAQPPVASPAQPASEPVQPAQSAAAAAEPVQNAPAAAEPVAGKPSPVPKEPEWKPVREVRSARPAPNPEPVEVASNATPEPAPAAPPDPAARPAVVEPPPVAAPAAAPAPPPTVTLNAGMLIPVRLIDGLSSERNNPGDAFTATLDRELVVSGFVIAERGARVEGRVVAADRGGRVRGTAALAIELIRIHTSDGQAVAIQTNSFEKHAEQSQRQDAEKIGAAAAIGAVIGAIAGGGKGAAVGAGVGGGAGAGGVLLTRGRPAALPSETRVNFRLRAPVTITERGGIEPFFRLGAR